MKNIEFGVVIRTLQVGKSRFIEAGTGKMSILENSLFSKLGKPFNVEMRNLPSLELGKDLDRYLRKFGGLRGKEILKNSGKNYSIGLSIGDSSEIRSSTEKTVTLYPCQFYEILKD